MRRKIGLLFAMLIGWVLPSHPAPSLPDDPPKTLIQTLNTKDAFLHETGRAADNGWEMDYRKHRAGYALLSMREPLKLDPGLYRATFSLRRGLYPIKGLLRSTFGMMRIELWDVTKKELITQRHLQLGDLNTPNIYEDRWIEFSMRGREGHAVEPRVFWIGLVNGEIGLIRIERFPDVSPAKLEQKASALGLLMESQHLENGFVVSRKLDGEADETGDATTYTGFYVASLAWKYAVTKDPATYQILEAELQAMHNALKGTPERPFLTRFVDEEGNPFPKPPSKDVYTSFFLAYSVAFPHIENASLKKQMRQDATNIVTRLLKDDLNVGFSTHPFLSLTPYFTRSEIHEGIRHLFKNKKLQTRITKGLKLVNRYVPFGEPWAGIKVTMEAIKKNDELKLLGQVVPTLNGIFRVAERVRDILREQYRNDLFPARRYNNDYPGKLLADFIAVTLKKFPLKKDGRRFHRLSDLRVLGSHALISLHIVKTASALTKKPQFAEYYNTNLYTQESLLSTALNWYGADEDIIRLTAGNPVADQERRGYLGALAMMNLITLETNPNIKDRYRELLRREWRSYRHEDNPMMTAMALVCLNEDPGLKDLVLRGLDLYPEDRLGFGKKFWEEKGNDIANRLGGGHTKGYSREPLPISHRPKDSFLWQRSARRIKGDHEKNYPATDYLFVYWFGRYHGIIPAPEPEPQAFQRKKQ